MVAATLAAALCVALLAAYTSALARLPQQRAALEALLRSQTGLDVRFAALALRIGFYGPELHFTSIEMRRPGDSQRLLRARELVARFDTWRLLQSGQLRPGRVVLIGAELDADALQRLGQPRVRGLLPSMVPASRDDAQPSSAAAIERKWIAAVASLGAAMPPVRLEFEASTLRWAAASAAGEPTVLRIPRLSFERRADGLRASGTAMLPKRLGRLLFVALDLRGIGSNPVATARSLSGSATIQTRAIELGAFREFDTPLAWLPAGQIDTRLLLRFRAGTVSQASVAVAARDLRPRSAGAPIDRLDATVQFERQQQRWRFVTTDLRIMAADLPDRRVVLRWDLDPASGAAQLDAAAMPAAWLMRFAAHALAPLAARIDLGGDLNALRLTRAAARTGGAWMFRAELRDLIWRDGDGTPLLEGLQGSVRGDPQQWTLVLGAATGGGTQRLTPQGRLIARREAAGWRVRGEDLVLAQAGLPRVALAADLMAPDSSSARIDATLRLLAPMDTTEFPQLLQLARGDAEARWGRSIESLSLSAGSVRLVGSIPALGPATVSAERGDLQIAAASFRPADGWPKVIDAGGRARWSGQRLRIDFDAGRIGGLEMREGSVDWRGEPRWRMRAQGDVAEVARLLRASPIGADVPAELLALDLSGPAELEFALQTDARRTRASWSSVVRLDEAVWRPMADAVPVTGLSGELRLADGRLQPSRLRGRWQGGDLRVALRNVGGQPRAAISGVLPRASLAELSGAAIGGDWPSSIDWRIDVARRGATRTTPATWRVEGALGGRMSALLTLTPVADGGFFVERGAVRFGAGSPQLPTVAGLQVSGTATGLDLLRTSAALHGALQTLDARTGWRGELRVRDMRVLGQSVGDVQLQFADTPGRAVITLDGERLRGLAELRAVGPAAAAVPRLELDRLVLDDLPGTAASGMMRATHPWAAEIDIDDLSIAGRRLGRWQGRIAGGSEHIEIPALRFADGGRRGSAQLRCGIASGTCRLELDWTGTAPDSLLAAEISEGRATLSWPVAGAREAAASDRAIASLDGHLSMRAAKGRLRASESSSPAADVLEQALFAPALAVLTEGSIDDATWDWNRLDVDAALQDGVLRLERYTIDGALRRLQIAGRVLPSEGRADLIAEWVPAQPFSVAVGRWPAGPALLAAWSAVRDLIPDDQEPGNEPSARFSVAGPIEQLSVSPLPLQSAAAP